MTDVRQQLGASSTAGNANWDDDLVLLHRLLQHLITAVKQLMKECLIGALAGRAVTGVSKGSLDVGKKQILFQIGGYLVSELVKKHLQGAQQSLSSWCHIQLLID
jgi:hypothetical protein